MSSNIVLISIREHDIRLTRVFLQFLSAIRLHGDETARSKVFILNKKCLIKYVIVDIRVFETETEA